jgi:hypothetical protein
VAVEGSVAGRGPAFEGAFLLAQLLEAFLMLLQHFLELLETVGSVPSGLRQPYLLFVFLPIWELFFSCCWLTLRRSLEAPP